MQKKIVKSILGNVIFNIVQEGAICILKINFMVKNKIPFSCLFIGYQVPVQFNLFPSPAVATNVVCLSQPGAQRLLKCVFDLGDAGVCLVGAYINQAIDLAALLVQVIHAGIPAV